MVSRLMQLEWEVRVDLIGPDGDAMVIPIQIFQMSNPDGPSEGAASF